MRESGDGGYDCLLVTDGLELLLRIYVVLMWIWLVWRREYLERLVLLHIYLWF